MNRTSFAAALCLLSTVPVVQAQESEWGSLSARMDLVSEDALTIPVDPSLPVTVGTADCDLDEADVPAFDVLLVLDEPAQEASLATHAVLGLPEIDPQSEFLLYQSDYVIAYSRSLLLPVLASYQLNAADIKSRTREECFREDERLDTADRSTLSDYTEPTFDRGHLVPRADMNRTREAMINSFVLSNMMPQHDNFNRGVWETLEGAVRAWALGHGSITVLTGPVFDGDDDGAPDDDSEALRVQPDDKVAIPTGFYKIVLHQQDTGFIDALAILLPHTDDEVPLTMTKEEKLAYIQEHIVSIDDIEALTGLDFFAEMSDTKEQALEHGIAAGLWD